MALSTSLPTWKKQLQTLRSEGGVIAMVGGLVVRNYLNDHPIVVSTLGVGPTRLVQHLCNLDGSNLNDVGLGEDSWRLNALVDVTDIQHPLTAAQHLIQSSRVRSVHVITTAYQGLFTGWFGMLCKRRVPPDALKFVSPILQALARTGHTQPASANPAVLLLNGRDIRTTCEHGEGWVRAPGFSKALRRAAKTPNKAAWFCGARITFTGVDTQLVASVVPCTRSDVLAVARLTRRERRLVQLVASGTPNADIARMLDCPESAIVDELARIEHNRVPGGIQGLLRLVEQGWYSASSL